MYNPDNWPKCIIIKHLIDIIDEFYLYETKLQDGEERFLSYSFSSNDMATDSYYTRGGRPFDGKSWLHNEIVYSIA
jgi:hypothetical protein